MDNPFYSPNVLSICTGMRGLERGIERVVGPIRTVAYVEIEAFIIENLVQQMEQGVLAPAPVWTDIKTFPSEFFHGKIHGITGGYPCQPFSKAGKQRGTEDPRHLWPYIERVVRAIKPVWCFFENVPNHLKLGYQQVRSELEGLGYKVEEGLFSAEEVGAPHIRSRLFVLAVADANNCDGGIRSGKIQIASGETEESEQRERRQKIFRERMRNEFRSGSSEMGNTKQQGLERLYKHEHPKSERERSTGSIATTGFPLGQGHDQHEWEEPRLESRLGFSVNGYNFREDLLRMAGNGVVEQTAEFAFKSLMKKFF